MPRSAPVVSMLVVCLALAACGSNPAPLTCGEGTVAKEGKCVLASDPVFCGAGTVGSDAGCVVAPPPMITQARLTLLKVKHDVSKPMYLNNPLPIRFGITSKSANPAKPVTTNVNVVFSFIEASPVDPLKPNSCDSNGLELALVGSGIEQVFEANIFPTDMCKAWLGTGVTVNLAVDFDQGLRLSNTPTGIDYPPVVFSPANAMAAANQLCRTASNPADPKSVKGCVYPLRLTLAPLGTDGKPLIDVKMDSFTAQSSVAVLWSAKPNADVPAGKKESQQPSMIVNTVLLLNGRDPYKHKIDPSQLSPELKAAVPTLAKDLEFGLTPAELDALDDLPGKLAMKYDLAPTNKITTGGWLPLTINDPKNPDPEGHVNQIDLKELEPGTENAYTHELYIEGATRAAFAPDAGAWAADDDFTVRGCAIVDFPEGGNPGEVDVDDAPVGGEVPGGNCKTIKVRLVRTPSFATSNKAHAFDMTWERTAGNVERVALVGKLRTNNTLDLSGARTDTEGTVQIQGKIGTDFSVMLFRAFAKGGALTTLGSSYIDTGIEIFGTSVFGHQNNAAEQAYELPFMVAKDFQFLNLGFGFGPVRIGISAGVGGNVGITPSLTINAKTGPEASVPELAAATSNGQVIATITPTVGLTGNVTGGINIFVAAAQIIAKVQIVEIGFPVTANMRWGVTELDADMMTVKKLTILGELKWDMTITWLNVTVDAVGRILFFSRTFNIWKFQNTIETTNLLTRKLDAPIVLE